MLIKSQRVQKYSYGKEKLIEQINTLLKTIIFFLYGRHPIFEGCFFYNLKLFINKKF